ncbi:zinc-dependent alcohol dehydrogenase family protein [Nocardiopsis rhodophaea]|uniref:Zinc-dependent alcohol dehydrogenase family protein n=1 Tax=Nocardiopsis rhodophaea TaxID=280238 RepID=A0ABN2TGK3_9ACTN
MIRVGACGICGTGLHIADGEFPPNPDPLVPGHEFAGEMVAVGDGAPGGLRVGDRVAVDPSLFCGYCTFCRSGRGYLCANRSATGDTVDGAFAQHAGVPAANCYRAPEGMDEGEGALVEPLSCVVHGVRRIGVSAGERFLVVGVGAMALLLQQLLQQSWARVTLVDRATECRRIAAELRAYATAADADLHGERFDAAVDATGAPPAIEAAFDALQRGGRLLISGVATDDARISLSPLRVYNNEITVAGSMAVLNSVGAAADRRGDVLATRPRSGMRGRRAAAARRPRASHRAAARHISDKPDQHCLRPGAGSRGV